MADHRRKSIKALMLTRYTYEGASSRYRMFQFIPYLDKSGFECVVFPFFQAGYTKLRFANRKALVLRTVEDYWRRFRRLKCDDDIDVIFLEKEFFPYINFGNCSMNITKKIHYVCDYDDAWFHAYDNHRSRIVRWLFHDKIAKVMAGAYAVIAGSEYLYDYACRFNRNVHLVPTAIDLDLYPDMPPPRRTGNPFLIGWIGSYSSISFLKIVEPVLEEFCMNHDARVVVIGDSKGTLNLRYVNCIPWTESTEVESLSEIDVGIMPLSDTPQSRGKCAFKLIQYMGCWKPVIASPVGENVRVVQDGISGVLAATPEDWWNALCRLYDDHALRDSMGIAGRAIVEKSYSLSVVAPRVEAILRSACSAVRGDV